VVQFEKWPSIFHQTVAGWATEMRAVFRLKSPKAIGNANHLQIEESIGLRNGDRAGLSALRTPKILNPIVVAFRHLQNMRPESGVFQSGALPHSNWPTTDFWRTQMSVEAVDICG
jgi:hypothetical protein